MAKERVEILGGRVSRRTAIGGLSAATAAALAARLADVQANEEESGAPGATVVGVGKYGRNGIEFLGRINQSGFDFEVFGYVTYINGLDPKLLFKNGNPFKHKVEDARFTFVSNLEGKARSMFDTIFAVTASGDIRFFYNKPGGSTFNDPGTFSHGKVIASGDMRLQNVINATGEMDGIANGSGDFAITKVSTFSIPPKTYQLSAKGLHYRAGWSGDGVLTDPEPPNSEITFAGNAFILRS